MNDMGLNLKNIINDDYKLDDPIPAWFRSVVGIPHGVPEPPKAMALAHPLAGLTKLGSALPSLKFFEPKPNFVKWMKDSFGRKNIFDCGCGTGHVAKMLSAAGMKVTAIDSNHRDTEEFDVEIADATVYAYPSGSVVMLARPCHGFFTEAVVEQAAIRGVSAVVYIGKTKSVKDDLRENYRDFKKELTMAGKEHENVWVWRIR
jgi:hypothetical protein